MFYNHPRYDCVSVQFDDGIAFAQLALVFSIVIEGTLLPIALVHLFDQQNSPQHAKKDKELHFLRLRQQSKTCFIWARSIIRGVLIFSAFDDERDSIVFDDIDTDMFLRVSEILKS